MQISLAVEAAGYAADNVTYGMGGGLLQKVDRDTMSFATKLNHITYAGAWCEAGAHATIHHKVNAPCECRCGVR